MTILTSSWDPVCVYPLSAFQGAKPASRWIALLANVSAFLTRVLASFAEPRCKLVVRVIVQQDVRDARRPLVWPDLAIVSH